MITVLLKWQIHNNNCAYGILEIVSGRPQRSAAPWPLALSPQEAVHGRMQADCNDGDMQQADTMSFIFCSPSFSCFKRARNAMHAAGQGSPIGSHMGEQAAAHFLAINDSDHFALVLHALRRPQLAGRPQRPQQHAQRGPTAGGLQRRVQQDPQGQRADATPAVPGHHLACLPAGGGTAWAERMVENP